MIDKGLETDREVTLDFSLDIELPSSNNNQSNYENAKHENILIDLIEQKRAADLAEKICPMCGKFYTQEILFEEFQEHVESHFRAESNENLSHDLNFEMVSHSFGNF